MGVMAIAYDYTVFAGTQGMSNHYKKDRMFGLYNIGANMTVPMFGIIVRKAYGLGVQAMCGSGSLFPAFTVSWPTGEFYGMNIEGSVKLGYRRELEAIEDTEK